MANTDDGKKQASIFAAASAARDVLLSQGWVTRKEFCRLAGRSDGGHMAEQAISHGVRCVMVGKAGDREAWLFRPEDASKLPPISVAALPGGENNGGILGHRIAELERRVKALEEFKAQF